MRKTLTRKLNFRRKQSILLLLFIAVFAVFSHPGLAGTDEGLYQVQVSGTVVEASTGLPLPGVSILIKGTSTGTITDQEGKFSINASAENILVFSFMGFQDQEVVVGSNTEISISLVEDAIGLDEIVVTGYGIQKKSDLTGSIASVSGDDLADMSVISADQALQGKAAGVSVMPTTGLPGGSINIAIRGISSINGTQPLVIVDGVRASLSDLNPSDIESVEVLKDASSAAIYGSAGGNGVILVTTKNGVSGKPKVNFNYYAGFQKPWKKLDMMNAQEYAEINDILEAMNDRPLWSESFEDPLQNYDYQDLMMQTGIMEDYDFSVGGGNEFSTYYLSANYTKQEGVLKKTSYDRFNIRIKSDHQLTKRIKIGENVTFTRSVRDGFQEWMFQNAFNSPFTNVLTMVPYLPPYTTRYDETYPSLSGEEFPLSTTTVMPIFKHESDPSLDRKWSYNESAVNPQRDIDIIDYTGKTYTIGGKFNVGIDLFKGFTYNSVVNSYTTFRSTENFAPEYFYRADVRNDVNELEKELSQEYGWEAQNYFNYNLELNSVHNFSLMGGGEIRYKKWSNVEVMREAILNESEEMRYLRTSTDQTSLSQLPEGRAYEDAAYAYFGRLTYDYNSKYLVNLSIRKDYSSRFGPDYRSGVFPSASLGWKFSEESFIKNLGLISFGKLRLGYGENGANAPGYYAYYARVSADGALLTYPLSDDVVAYQGATLSQLPNDEMHWETMIMTNIGVDLAFLENRLSLTVDYFEKTSEDMLMYQDLPATASIYQWSSQSHQDRLGGDARPLVNIGSVKNSGVEFTIGYKKMEGEFKASFQFNGTFQKNKVIELATDSITGGDMGVELADMCITIEGQPMAQFYGYKIERMFTEDDAAVDTDGDVYIWNQPTYIGQSGDTLYAQSRALPGDFKFTDVNGDGQINSDDRTIIGNPIPKFIMGFSASFEYKNFDLNVFFEGKFGHDLFYGSKLTLMDQYVGLNKLTTVLDQYHDDIYDGDGNLLFEANHNTDEPRLDPTNANTNFRVSDYYVESGNYLRLKNIQLGYTIPGALTSRIGITKFRIYVGARNLLTFTKYSGFDPEFSYSPTLDYDTGRKDMMIQGLDITGNYPQSRMFLMGVNLQF